MNSLFTWTKNMQADELQQQEMLSWSFESLIGGRSENQDFYGYSQTQDGSRLFVVCDGMGGMRGGSTASKEAVRVIMEEVSESMEPDPEKLLVNALQKANAAVFRLGQSKEELRGMGTTVVALLINKDKATAAHVGDSRIYQLRGKQIVFRTFDHSVVFELVKQGRLTEEQARLSPDSNLINRALGMKPEVEIEINGGLSYLKGDRFMLCTDGISGAIEEQKLIKAVASKKTVEETVKDLTAEIDTMGRKMGGDHDNMTIALIDANINSDLNTSTHPTKEYRLFIIILSVVVLLLIVSVGFNIYLFFEKIKYLK